MAKSFMQMFEDEEAKSTGIKWGKPIVKKTKKEKIPMVDVEKAKEKDKWKRMTPEEMKRMEEKYGK